MIRLTILLLICFIIQIIGYYRLRKSAVKGMRADDSREIYKRGMNYIAIGLVIQLIVIVSQIVVYFLVY